MYIECRDDINNLSRKRTLWCNLVRQEKENYAYQNAPITGVYQWAWETSRIQLPQLELAEVILVYVT
jgi:hypothetical protein